MQKNKQTKEPTTKKKLCRPENIISCFLHTSRAQVTLPSSAHRTPQLFPEDNVTSTDLQEHSPVEDTRGVCKKEKFKWWHNLYPTLAGQLAVFKF